MTTGNVEVDNNRSESTPGWAAIPDGWEPVDAATLDGAVSRSLDALSMDGPDPVHHRLARYYDRHGEYAGATFLNLGPSDWQDIIATDLLATALLGVSFTAADVRRLLEPSSDRRRVTRALHNLPDTELLVAGPEVLMAMSEFYEAVKEAVSTRTAQKSDRWVVASKLCARKRPDLFPVRDGVVRERLDILRHGNYQVDWQVFRHLIGHPEVVMAIDRAQDAVREMTDSRDVHLDSSRLRLLDVALWMTPRSDS